MDYSHSWSDMKKLKITVSVLLGLALYSVMPVIGSSILKPNPVTGILNQSDALQVGMGYGIIALAIALITGAVGAVIAGVLSCVCQSPAFSQPESGPNPGGFQVGAVMGVIFTTFLNSGTDAHLFSLSFAQSFWPGAVATSAAALLVYGAS